MAGYLQSLIRTESGGNWAAKNNEKGAGGKAGHFGRVQFGHARLQDAMNAGAIPRGTTPEQFMASPDLQMAAEKWHFGDLENQLGGLVGSVVNGRKLDLGALVAMGHLGGAGGARRYVQTGGKYNPSDAFGTSLSDYAATHGGGGSDTVAGGLSLTPKSGADTMDTPRQGLLGQLARPDEKVGGLLGMMFGNMSPDRADQLRANLGGLQGINNQGMVDAARGRMAARSGARESDLNYARQQQQVEQERAREAQRTAQAQAWIEQNAPPEIAAAVRSGVVTAQQAYVAMQGGKKTESEMKIARLMEDGLSRETAIGIVDGRLVVSRDPTTQEATIIDKATGKVVEGSSTQAGTQEPSPYEDVNAGGYSPIPDLGDNAGDAFGVEGTVKGAINKVAGAAGLKTPFEDVQEVSNNFAVFNESLLSDLSNGYQRQPPVIIMKALQDLLPKPGQVFEGAGGAQSKLNSLEVSINTEKSVVQRSLSRKQSPTNRQENEARLDALNAALARVSAMKETFGASGTNSTSTGVGWKVVE